MTSKTNSKTFQITIFQDEYISVTLHNLSNNPQLFYTYQVVIQLE